MQFKTFTALEMTVECADGAKLPEPKPPSGALQSLLTRDEEDAKYRCEFGFINVPTFAHSCLSD